MAHQQRGLREMALFAGAGGGILGGKLLGWETVCAVEINSFCARRLMQRQNEGHLPPFPIWDDVSTFDGRELRGCVDVVSGGFPCQDISAAGDGVGIDGERSGLWKQMARIIGEVGPRYVLVENSPMLAIRGHGVVLRDLAQLGYNARWGVLSAFDAGMDHNRKRMWIVANANGQRMEGFYDRESIVIARDERTVRERREACEAHMRDVAANPFDGGKYGPQSMLLGAKDGFPGWVDRIKRIGNAQVPAVAELAWKILS